jgi:pimeloyl-ACP methyl ester carboxylesterase
VLADPVERKLDRLRAPTVVVRGSRDPIVPRGWAREVAALLPDGRLVELPGIGHAAHHAAPGELARITRSLLREAGREPHRTA